MMRDVANESFTASRDVQRGVLRWYAEEARSFPWRSTRDPYRILVAEVMLQQTQTARVVPAYTAFLKRFPSVKALARASAGEVIRSWQGLGYNRRAVNLHRASQWIAANGFPCDLEGLRGLPGVGPYTAAAVASFSFGAHVPVVDTNVRRVLGRAVLGRDQADVGLVAHAWLPVGHAYEWNQALMDLGATLCKPLDPRCDVCPFKRHCVFRRVGQSDRPTQKKTNRFAGSTRQRRGAIVEQLRAVGSIKVSAMPETDRALLEGLERDGLVVSRRGAVRLP